MRKVLHVAGARPNFMKVAPLFRALAWRGQLSQVLVHTGQHYDSRMSDVFFSDLELPPPHHHLGVGSGSHAEQTARVMLTLDPVLEQERPDLVSVVGDVNSTLAATLVAVKRGVPVAHVEAGLRSFDRSQPEELNRVLTDQVSELLLTPSEDADENLLHEGVDPARIHRVGNIMVDTLLACRARAEQLPVLERMGLEPRGYAVCTLHRPSNVDHPPTLRGLLGALATLARRLPVVFPVHPRTRKQLEQWGLGVLLEEAPWLYTVEPLGYLELLSLTSRARLILTDSGGLQEEATVLGVPCLTLREHTERPITVEQGTNQVVGTHPERILYAAEQVLAGHSRPSRVPELWDGRTAERIARVYEQALSA